MKFEKMTRNELRDLLSENVLRVTFDKKNGEKRVMTCTLKKDYLPEAKGSESVCHQATGNCSEATPAQRRHHARMVAARHQSQTARHRMTRHSA